MDSKAVFEEFKTKGFAVIKNAISSPEIQSILRECSKMVQNMEIPEHCSVFHTGRDQARDEYFINSGDKIAFFFEKDAVDQEGNLLVEKELALNKIGHALHWLNPVFKNVTFSEKIKNVLKNFQFKKPVVVQSMVIFKHPEIGGEVTPHQDSTFLFTEPLTTIGFWFPLVDITLENGCLWFIPGSHKEKIYQRYKRVPSGQPLLEILGDMPHFDHDLYVPVLAEKGDCVVIHGSVIHKSGKNLSSNSRPIYTFHVVEQENTEYSPENWLQPTKELPFPAVTL